MLISLNKTLNNENNEETIEDYFLSIKNEIICNNCKKIIDVALICSECDKSFCKICNKNWLSNDKICPITCCNTSNKPKELNRKLQLKKGLKSYNDKIELTRSRNLFELKNEILLNICNQNRIGIDGLKKSKKFYQWLAFYSFLFNILLFIIIFQILKYFLVSNEEESLNRYYTIPKIKQTNKNLVFVQSLKYEDNIKKYINIKGFDININGNKTLISLLDVQNNFSTIDNIYWSSNNNNIKYILFNKNDGLLIKSYEEKLIQIYNVDNTNNNKKFSNTNSITNSIINKLTNNNTNKTSTEILVANLTDDIYSIKSLLLISNNNKTYLISGQFGSINIWDISQNNINNSRLIRKIIHSQHIASSLAVLYNKNEFKEKDIDIDNSSINDIMIVSGHFTHNGINIWNFTTGDLISSLPDYLVTCISVFEYKNESYIISGSYKRIKIWKYSSIEAKDTTLIRTIYGGKSYITALLPVIINGSPAIISGDKRGGIYIWKFLSGKKIKKLGSHKESIKSLFTIKVNNELLIISKSKSGINLWN